MSSIAYFFWLGTSALGVSIVLFPTLTVFVMFAAIAAVVAAVRKPDPLRHKWKWLLLPFAIPLAILIYGAAFHFGGAPGSAPPWRAGIVEAMFWLHAFATLAILILGRRNPLVPLGLGCVQTWLSIGATFMSSMSVTNLWS